MVETAVAAAAIVSAVAGAASVGYSVHQGRMERRHAKGVAREQARQAADQKAAALEQRKSLIDGQREQLAGVIGGYNTNPTGQTGASVLKKKTTAGQETLG